jgi:hypothetical protein
MTEDQLSMRSLTITRTDTRERVVTHTREGLVILRKPWQRVLFVAGHVGSVLLALVLGHLFIR